MKTLIENLVLVLAAKTIKGTSFIGLRSYTNKQGEVSNQTIVAGITYENCLVNDFQSLQENQTKIFESLVKDYSSELIKQAYENLYTSLEKRLSSEEVKEELRKQNDKTILLSDAQKDAYVHITKGVKVNKLSNEIHVFGLVVRKEILQAIEYKSTNPRELTIVQNKIKKLCEFKQDKYRSFIFNQGEVKLQGITL